MKTQLDKVKTLTKSFQISKAETSKSADVTIPIISLLRKAQLARELSQFFIFLLLILFMGLTSYKFLGDSEGRMYVNDYLKNCVNNVRDYEHVYWIGMDSDEVWQATEQCLNSMVDRGLRFSKDGVTGTARIADYLKIVTLSISHIAYYRERPCEGDEVLDMAGHQCVTVQFGNTFDDRFGLNDTYSKTFRREDVPAFGSTFLGNYNGSTWGMYEFREYIVNGTETNLQEAKDKIKTLGEQRFFNASVYHFIVDLVTYTEVAEELNYHSLIFSRFSGRGFSLGTGKESIAYQTTIYGLPMSIYSRAWESGSQTRSLSGTSGLGFQLIFSFCLLVTWRFYFIDFFNAFNKNMKELKAIERQEAAAAGERTQVKRLMTTGRKISAGIRFFFLKYAFNIWNVVDLGFLVLATAFDFLVIIVVIMGRGENWYKRVPSAPTDPSNTWSEYIIEMYNANFYLNFFQYGVSLAFFVAMFKAFRYLRLVPGVRVYELLISKAWPRLKDFLLFFVMVAIFLSLTTYALFSSSGGNPLFTSFANALARSFEFTFGHLDKERFLNYGIGVGLALGVVFACFWVLVIALSIIAQNILIALISDAYTFATTDPEIMTEMYYLSETSALSMCVTLMMYYLTLVCFTVPLNILSFISKRATKYNRPVRGLKYVPDKEWEEIVREHVGPCEKLDVNHGHIVAGAGPSMNLKRPSKVANESTGLPYTSFLYRDEAYGLWNPWTKRYMYPSFRTLTTGIKALLGRFWSPDATEDIVSKLRGLLLEWDLAHQPQTQILLYLFEDPATDQIQESVFQMHLRPIELYNVYLMGHRALQDEKFAHAQAAKLAQIDNDKAKKRAEAHLLRKMRRMCWSWMGQLRAFLELKDTKCTEQMHEVINWVNDVFQVYGRNIKVAKDITDATENALRVFTNTVSVNTFIQEAADAAGEPFLKKDVPPGASKAAQMDGQTLTDARYRGRLLPITAFTNIQKAVKDLTHSVIEEIYLSERDSLLDADEKMGSMLTSVIQNVVVSILQENQLDGLYTFDEEFKEKLTQTIKDKSSALYSAVRELDSAAKEQMADEGEAVAPRANAPTEAGDVESGYAGVSAKIHPMPADASKGVLKISGSDRDERAAGASVGGVDDIKPFVS